MELPPLYKLELQAMLYGGGGQLLCAVCQHTLSLSLWENQLRSAQTTSRRDVITFHFSHSLRNSSLHGLNIMCFYDFHTAAGYSEQGVPTVFASRGR
jgi:hypothetical protein